MTRSEIERDYKVVDGIIRSPGKFEGEPVYAPYLWDASLDGFGDMDEEDIIRLELCADDVKEFPELAGYTQALIQEDSNGFVYVEVVK